MSTIGVAVVLIGVVVGPATIFAQYGGGGFFFSPVVVPHGSAGTKFTSSGAPATGQVLGASTYSFTSTFGRGASSDSVTQLQERLRADGFFTFPRSTGFFGPITFAAVQAFQRAHGIPATGFVGPRTLAALNG